MTEAGTSPVHPVLAGRLEASEQLAASVRRLLDLCTATTAPPGVTLAAARGLDAIADVLARHVPDPLPPKTVLNDPADGDTDLAARMPFDVVIGGHNPLALPLALHFEGTTAVLTGTFTRPYEGPPGCVHGAVIASSFDIACAAANFISRVPGPTRRLEITYRRPTLLAAESRLEARVETVEGRSVRTVGRLVQNGGTTVEAVGDFVLLTREDIARMSTRPHDAR